MLDKGRQSGSNNIYKLFLWQTPDIRHIQTKLLVYESTERYNLHQMRTQDIPTHGQNVFQYD